MTAYTWIVFRAINYHSYFLNLKQKGSRKIPIIGINVHIRFKNSIIKFVLILLALIASLSATSNLLKSLHNA